MSANVIFAPFAAPRAWFLALLAAAGVLLAAAGARGDENEEAEMAVAKLVHPLEKAGYDFRADVWERELKPDLGKAVRLQLFKGNEYRVCVAVAEHSGVQIEAHLLDINGENIEAAVDKRGWGAVLTAKPKHTGVYIVTIRQAGGKPKPVTCVLIMGYR
ncbi:MAG TPA: hypothetical protein VGH65_00800 [Verrucomicrobiaceae bacterium]|jgi:hypothetical protein